MLKWASENGCPWDAYTCSGAAGNGHLDALKWARANGCPWNISTAGAAAYSGQLEVLKWAHENDCPGWGEYICDCAAAGGQLEVL